MLHGKDEVLAVERVHRVLLEAEGVPRDGAAQCAAGPDQRVARLQLLDARLGVLRAVRLDVVEPRVLVEFHTIDGMVAGDRGVGVQVRGRRLEVVVAQRHTRGKHPSLGHAVVHDLLLQRGGMPRLLVAEGVVALVRLVARHRVDEDQPVRAVLVLEQKADALALELPADEVVVGLVVLDAVLVLPVTAIEPKLVVPETVLVQDLLHDFLDILVVKDAAVAAEREKPEPWHAGHQDAVVPADGADETHVRDVGVEEPRLVPHGVERHGEIAAEKPVVRDVRRAGDRLNLHMEEVADPLAHRHRLETERAGAQGGVQPDTPSLLHEVRDGHALMALLKIAGHRYSVYASRRDVVERFVSRRRRRAANRQPGLTPGLVVEFFTPGAHRMC